MQEKLQGARSILATQPSTCRVNVRARCWLRAHNNQAQPGPTDGKFFHVYVSPVTIAFRTQQTSCRWNVPVIRC